MEDSLRAHALQQRRESRQTQIFTRQEHESIAQRLGKGARPLAPALKAVTGFAAHQRRRGAGGARQQPATLTDDELTLTVSERVLQTFRLARTVGGEPILLRERPKTGGWWPVVALEDLAELMSGFHSEEGTGFAAADKLFTTVRAQRRLVGLLVGVRCRLHGAPAAARARSIIRTAPLTPPPAPTPALQLYNQAPCKLKAADGTTYTVFGLEGFGHKAVEAFLKECPIRARSSPTSGRRRSPL